MKKPKLYKPKKLSSRKQFRSSQSKSTRRARFYGEEWNKYRRRYLHYNKHCYACGASSEHGARLHLDHLIVHRGNMELFWNETNIIPLCHHCHSVVTARFDRLDEQDLDGKLKWLKDQRKAYNNNSKVLVVSMNKKP